MARVKGEEKHGPNGEQFQHLHTVCTILDMLLSRSKIKDCRMSKGEQIQSFQDFPPDWMRWLWYHQMVDDGGDINVQDWVASVCSQQFGVYCARIYVICTLIFVLHIHLNIKLMQKKT